MGRRVVKDVAGGAAFDYYYNESWQVVNELKDGSQENIFHWHPYYIDALAAAFHGTGQTAYYFLHDANFNVTAVVHDDGGSKAVVERYSYTPYGEVTILEDDFDVASPQQTTINNRHLYTGRERDAETGLQLNRHRFYAAHLGRWVTRDPIGYADGFNLYKVYFIPNSVDPFGLECKPKLVSGSRITNPRWPQWEERQTSGYDDWRSLWLGFAVWGDKFTWRYEATPSDSGVHLSAEGIAAWGRFFFGSYSRWGDRARITFDVKVSCRELSDGTCEILVDVNGGGQETEGAVVVVAVADYTKDGSTAKVNVAIGASYKGGPSTNIDQGTVSIDLPADAWGSSRKGSFEFECKCEE